MDKLKPLIEHHFWILFFVVLLLPVIGWWPTANGLREETEKQISTIDSAFSAIPAGSQANESWSKGLNKIAERAEEQNQEERVFLWDRQWKMMTWPNSILKKNLPDEYREVINLTSRNVYKGVYDLEVERVWKTADPFDYETGKGTVLLDLETVPREKFGKLTPTSEELWDAQEDLWLLESLFKSIKEANQGAKNVTESVVRRIDLIELVGGPGNYPDAEPSSGGASGGMGSTSEAYDLSEMDFNSGDDDDEGNGSFGGFGATGRKSVAGGDVSFDPSDEFGEEQGRYIDFEEGTIYRKRGFYLEAVVDHERLPDLLVALTNGSWPVTITRVQMAKLGSNGMSSSRRSGRFSSGNPYETESSSMEEPEEGTFGLGFGRTGTGRLSTPSFGRGKSAYGGRTSRPGTGKHAEEARAAVIGNNLAKVAISGVIYICNPPEIAEDAATSPTEQQLPSEQPEQPEQPEQGNSASSGTADPGTPKATEEKKEEMKETQPKPDAAKPADAKLESKTDKPESSDSEKPVEEDGKEGSGKTGEKSVPESTPKPKADT